MRKNDFLHRYRLSTEQFYRYVRNHDPQELLGWSSKKSQYLRFDILHELAVESLGLQEHDSVTDVGCGLGALYDFFVKKKKKYRYHGIDSSKKYLRLAAKRFPETEFTVLDVLTKEAVLPQSDVAFLSGVLNLNIGVYYPTAKLQREAKYAVVVHVLSLLSRSSGKGFVSNFLHVGSKDRSDIFNYHDPDELIAYLNAQGFVIVDKRVGYLDNDFSLAFLSKKNAGAGGDV